MSKYTARRLDDILVDAKGTVIRSPEDWEVKAAAVRKSVEWMLGDRPPRTPPIPLPANFRRPPAPANRPPSPDDLTYQGMNGGDHYGWRKPEADMVSTELAVRFGQGLTGDLFYPSSAASDAKLPVVIWLHSYGTATGYMWAYRGGLSPILALVKGGYAVFAFDQAGFGRRVLDAKRHSERFPHWSRLGRMIDDTRAAIDYLQTNGRVDAQRIYLFGYSIGGTLGIYTAALDARVKGLVAISGFTPMRLDTAGRGAGGVARYSHQQDLVPRLGLFSGSETKIPYDFHELLGAIAPRPVLIVQPQLDRDAHPADVRTAVEQARKVFTLYGAGGKIDLNEPWDYNRLPDATQEWIVQKWMVQNLR